MQDGLDEESGWLEFRRLASKYHLDLIDAEEALLEVQGWTLVKRQGSASVWTNPQFVLPYSRNHAILILKAKDETIGYW